MTGSTPLEEIPDQPGAVTSAVANAIKPTVDKGAAPGVDVDAPPAKPPIVYRVLDDKLVSSAGTRALVRAGKELDPHQHNIRDLRLQGVKMLPINPETGEVALGEDGKQLPIP